MAWQLRGKFKGEAISGNGRTGAVLSLQQQTAPYPIMAHLRMGKTMIAVEGTFTKPTALAALDMRLKLSGASMARLYALTGIVLPETPPFATEGHLTGTLGPHGAHWIYDKFSGKVGSSDIGGRLDYRSKQPRALLSGTVVSHLLHFSDLAPVIGADSNAGKAERGAVAVQPTDKALPVEPFKTERWTSIDADITMPCKASNDHGEQCNREPEWIKKDHTPVTCVIAPSGYVEWVLGDLRAKSTMHIFTETDPATGALLHCMASIGSGRPSSSVANCSAATGRLKK